MSDEPTFHAVLVAEDLHRIASFTTAALRSAFMDGFSEGGGAYGAGLCAGYRVPEDMDELQRCHPKIHADAMKALARMGA